MARMLLILILLGASGVRADVWLTGSGSAETPEHETFTHRLACKGDLARWDFSGSRNLEGTVFYRGDRKVFWVVDPVQKSYFELPAVSPEDKDMRVGLLAFFFAVARKTLSTERAADLDRSLAGMPLPEMLLTFKSKGKAKVGRIVCRRYEAFSGGKKRADYFTADARALGLNGQDYGSLEAVLRACNRLYDNFDFLFPDATPPPARKGESYSGVPVRWVFLAEGKTVFTMEFNAVQEKATEDAWFQLPGGLKKVEVFDLFTNPR